MNIIFHGKKKKKKKKNTIPLQKRERQVAGKLTTIGNASQLGCCEKEYRKLVLLVTLVHSFNLVIHFGLVERGYENSFVFTLNKSPHTLPQSAGLLKRIRQPCYGFGTQKGTKRDNYFLFFLAPILLLSLVPLIK